MLSVDIGSCIQHNEKWGPLEQYSVLIWVEDCWINIVGRYVGSHYVYKCRVQVVGVGTYGPTRFID